MKKLEFKKYPNKGLTAEIMKILVPEMLSSVYMTFAHGTIEAYEDEWGNVSEEGSVDTLFLVLQEIYNYEVDDLFKIGEIESNLLLMLIEQEVILGNFPPTDDHLEVLVRDILRKNRFYYDKKFFRYKEDINFRAALIFEYKENKFRRLTIDWLIQLRDCILEDMGVNVGISDIQSTSNKPQLVSNTAAFFLSIYVLGELELGVIDKFPLYGSSDNITKEKVTRAAKWAMSNPMFNRQVNIDTLHGYLRDQRVQFTKHLPNVKEFLCSYYPDRKNEIESILIEMGKKFKENNQ